MFHNTSIYEQLAALPYLPGYKRLIKGAIELDVFSHRKESVSAVELARAWAGTRQTHCICCKGCRASAMRRGVEIASKTRRMLQNKFRYFYLFRRFEDFQSACNLSSIKIIG